MKLNQLITKQTMRTREQWLSLMLRHVRKNGPQLADINDAWALAAAGLLVSRGCPIAFAGLGVMGLGGIHQAFFRDYIISASHTIPNIGRLKNRDFRLSPPVVLASKERMFDLVDWYQLCGSYQKKTVQDFIGTLYDTLPVHLVLPLNQQNRRSRQLMRFTKRGKQRVSCAFMMATKYRPIQKLIHIIESEGKNVLLATSANPHGVRTYTQPKEVVATFGQIPLVLVDMNFIHQKRQNWPSHSMYDMTKFPDKVEVLRIGSVAHELYAELLQKSEFRPVVDFPKDKSDIWLTDKPPINNMQILKQVLKY